MIGCTAKVRSVAYHNFLIHFVILVYGTKNLQSDGHAAKYYDTGLPGAREK
jgi:hypothetical protein